MDSSEYGDATNVVSNASNLEGHALTFLHRGRTVIYVFTTTDRGYSILQSPEQLERLYYYATGR